MSNPDRREGSVLGAIAYILVPGERRKQAAGHFRKAGFEALRGVAALAKHEKTQESSTASQRQRIEIE
jgi:hypothetical protein